MSDTNITQQITWRGRSRNSWKRNQIDEIELEKIDESVVEHRLQVGLTSEHFFAAPTLAQADKRQRTSRHRVQLVERLRRFGGIEDRLLEILDVGFRQFVVPTQRFSLAGCAAAGSCPIVEGDD